MNSRSRGAWEGRVVSHYRVGPVLGSGGMSVVYRGRDLRLDRPVALKFLAPELCRDPDARARFLREAHAASSLDHPNICSVHAVEDTGEGQPFIAMACYDGGTVRDLLRGGPLPLDRALDLATQTGRGLAWAHEHGVLHRDVKPGNLLVTQTGTVKIVDFGLAKLAQEARITRTGMPLGTAAYMSPEQARGEEVDERTDVWALGVVLYEMLTGRRPFDGSDVTLVVHSVLHREAPRLGKLRPDVPRAVERVVEKALSKEPSRRFASMEAFVEVLEALRRGRLKAPRFPRLPRVRTRLARRRGPAAAAAALLAAGVLLVLWRPWAASGVTIDAIAVLPFADLSVGPEEPGFADVMTEGVITELQRFDGLRVISRTSVMHYADSDATIPEIARELGVDAVVEGSAVRDGHAVRVSAKLVRAEPEEALWVGSFERDLDGILALHAEVARRVAEESGVRLSQDEQARTEDARPRDVDPEAYLLYVRGRYHWNLGYHQLEGVERARGYFEEALERDPEFAAAWAGLADTWISPGCHGLISPEEAYPAAKRAVTRAMELDPDGAEALTSFAHLTWEYEHDWEAGERAFEKAIEMNPSYAPAHHIYGAGFLLRADRNEEALAQMRRALELNPLSANASADVAMALYKGGRFEEAEQQIRETQRAFPEWDPTPDLLGLAMWGKDYERVVRLAENIGSDHYFLYWGMVGEALARLGREDEARALLHDIQSQGRYVPRTTRAQILAHLGETDAALDLLEEAREAHEPQLTALMSDSWQPLEGHPRFEALLEDVGPPI